MPYTQVTLVSLCLSLPLIYILVSPSHLLHTYCDITHNPSSFPNNLPDISFPIDKSNYLHTLSSSMYSMHKSPLFLLCLSLQFFYIPIFLLLIAYTGTMTSRTNPRLFQTIYKCLCVFRTIGLLECFPLVLPWLALAVVPVWGLDFLTAFLSLSLSPPISRPLSPRLSLSLSLARCSPPDFSIICFGLGSLSQDLSPSLSRPRSLALPRGFDFLTALVYSFLYLFLVSPSLLTSLP